MKPDKITNISILRTGIAGISATYHLKKVGIDETIFEAYDVSSQIPLPIIIS